MGDLVGRIAATLMLVVVVVVLLFTAVVWPALLLLTGAATALGFLVRLLVDRSGGRTGLRANRRWLVLAGVATIAVGVLVAVRAQVNLAPHIVGNGIGGQLTELPLPYHANLTYRKDGGWTGREWFTLSSAIAKKIVKPGSKSLEARLRATVADGWQLRSRARGMYLIDHKYSSEAFAIPSSHPLTVSNSLPAPELRTTRFIFLPAAGSAVVLHAPERRIVATAPSSVESAETGSRVARSIALDVGPDKASSGVDVEIASDLATRLPRSWVGHGFWGLITGILTAIGLSLSAVIGRIRSGLDWLLKKRHPRTTRILHGNPRKNDALNSYLQRRNVAGQDLKSAVNLHAHEARTLASTVVANSSDPGARVAYDNARRALGADGVRDLDVVYRALTTAGISDDELDALDSLLDEAIITAHEGAPRAG